MTLSWEGGGTGREPIWSWKAARPMLMAGLSRGPISSRAGSPLRTVTSSAALYSAAHHPTPIPPTHPSSTRPRQPWVSHAPLVHPWVSHAPLVHGARGPPSHEARGPGPNISYQSSWRYSGDGRPRGTRPRASHPPLASAASATVRALSSHHPMPLSSPHPALAAPPPRVCARAKASESWRAQHTSGTLYGTLYSVG